MKAARNWIFIFITGAVLLVSCKGNTVYEEFNEIPEQGWETDSAVTLKARLYDTTHFHNIYLVFRINQEYPYSNFYSYVDITTPDKKKISNREYLAVARKDGKWLGTGMGDLRNFKFLIQKDFIVSDTGMYEFRIEQHMRDKVIPGIRDVGVLIEKGDEII